MRNIYCAVFCFLFFSTVYSQGPSFPGSGNRGAARQMNAGRFYGKVVDATNGKGIEFAAIQLFQNKLDSASNSMKNTLVSGALTEANGDFSIDKLPVLGEYTIKISSFGYRPYENKISFGLKPEMKNNPEQALNAIDKDLGNISLSRDTVTLAQVEVEGGDPPLDFSIDKKVYNVEKNPVSSGGTAVDVMKNVPTVNVDIDGNVTVRNASPQLFIDGRPTPLTLDQIPADAISTVELITNPSAKYDASGGGAGILNIVLKKSKRIGYSGSVRAGVDSYGKINAGGDINARENKVNVFLGTNYNQRKNKSTTETVRDYFGNESSPAILYNQDTESEMNGYFGMLRGGIDYFMDNRNTLTLSGTFNLGKFNHVDKIVTVSDTVSNGTGSHSERNSSTDREFSNNGFGASFKHLFPKAGNELTADFNYNRNSSEYLGLYDTKYFDGNGNSSGSSLHQEMHGTSGNEFITIQSDYVKPVNDKIKIEAGVRASVKTFDSETNNYILNNTSGVMEIIPNQTNDYQYIENIYAGYFTFTNSLNKFGYMLGLRLESSQYTGELFNQSLSFTNDYPISAFPSGFLSYKFSEDNNLQLNYTRRINRPGFFQILPYTDYADSLNLSRGNPALKPEFTNSFELSHQKVFSPKFNLLSGIYLKYTTDLITRYQQTTFDTVLERTLIVNTYLNANSSYAYGAEVTMKYTFSKTLDMTLNVNAYNSVINGENIESNLTNEQFTWFAKLNTNIKLPKNFSIQLTGDYQSETALNVSSGDSRGGGGRGGMGGGGWGGGSQSSVQGFKRPEYELDIAIKKEFLKDRAASVTLSISDVLDTEKNETYSESIFFAQNTLRQREPRIVRLNFSYRFGKFDVSLFKRKNVRNSMEDNGDMQ